MLTIGFDAKRLLFNRTGLGNYSRQWVNSLSHSPELNIRLYSPKPGLFKNHPAVTPKGNFGSSIWRTFVMGQRAQQDGCNLFHGLSNEIPVGRLRIPRICTIHDVIFKEFPSHYRAMDRIIYDAKTRYACRHADAIVATSETTKQKLIEYYGATPTKIHVVYQAIDSSLLDVKRVSSKDQPYLIYHSSFNPRKNQKVLIEAFNTVKHEIPYNLILIGDGSTRIQIEEMIKAYSLGQRISVKTFVDDEELKLLLSRAAGFVYPSQQEGFGIPLVEAAAFGLPMIVSDIDIFKEISDGKADAYVKPNSVSAWENALRNWVPNQESVDYRQILDKCDAVKMAKVAKQIYESVL